MIVVYAGGGGPRAYSLRVDGRSVGADDFLGVEEGHTPEDPESILGRMVHFGADQAKARRFLIHFKADMEERRLEGGLLQQSGAFGSADYSGEVGKMYCGVIGHEAPGSLTVGLLRVYCSLRCAAEAGHGRAQPIDRRGTNGLVDATDECFWCGASLWRDVR
jgi:hypothetical protein